jgi:tetratricopeptide (TPR) repeat protein
MSNGSNPPPSTAEADALVGEAWTAHYHGQNDDAIRKFEDVLQRWPDHIDANYGLALTLRTVGQKEKSVERFRKTKALLEAALAAEPDEVNARYVMLSRFCDQNIAMI